MVAKSNVKELLTINELLELYPNLKRSWLRRQIFFKQIPFLKIGGLIRFDLTEIDEWIESKKVSVNEGEL